MGTASIAPPITVEQYAGFKGYPGLRDELINGEIVLSPQPKPHHQEVVENLHRLLSRAFDGSAYLVRQSSNIRFAAANSMPAPDIFVVGRDIWRTAIMDRAYLSEPPLLVAEVQSPANRRRKVDEKCSLYLTHGVKHVWVVDLELNVVFIARQAGSHLIKQRVELIAFDEPVALSIKAGDILDLTI